MSRREVSGHMRKDRQRSKTRDCQAGPALFGPMHGERLGAQVAALADELGPVPDLGGMSLAEVGLALKSHLLAPKSEPAASVVNFVLRHSGLERGGISKDILPFPLSFCSTAAEISLSLAAGRAQFGQAEGAEASLDEYTQEAGLEAGHSWSPGL